MPTTETPPTESSTPPSRPPRRGRRDYRDVDELRGLETFDLLHVIEDIEDDRSRALLREKIWVALILHMIVFWYLLYGPKYIQHIRVVDPSTVLKQREKDMTFLDLPKDALQQLKTKQPRPAPTRAQPVPQTHVERKMLDQMRAARKAPVPPAPAPQPAPPQQQVAQAPPPPIERPAQPLPPSPAIEAPKPAPTQPNFNTGPATAGDAIRQAARQAAQGGAYNGGGDLGGAPSRGGMAGGVDVLSDTLGVDFGPYIQRIIYDTKRAWYPIIPEEAQPPLNKQGKVLVRFKILPDGSVQKGSMILEGPSGDLSLDRAAWGGITGASPYPPLPKNFKGPFLELRFYFLYNIRPGADLR